MNWLLLDTACPHAIVAIAQDEKILSQITLTETLKHGERLAGAISHCVADSGISMSDLNGVAVGKGPGSFVGVRVAMAHAKGICLALRIPMVGISTLSAMAASTELPLGEGMVCIDARRGEFYVLTVKRNDRSAAPIEISPPTAMTPDQLTLLSQHANFVAGFGGTFPFTVAMSGPGADGMLVMLRHQLSMGTSDKPRDETLTLTPAYVRAPDAKMSAG